MSYLPKLLAPEFSTHTAESFLAHVQSLKRAPARKPAKAPRLPKLSGKLQAKAHVLEIKSGKTLYALSYTVEKIARKQVKWIQPEAIQAASQALLQSPEAIQALLAKKGFQIAGAFPT